jgi:2-dehydro-3-deoxyphosphogluconate aldolase/(4S)-4-hydroxy-2-oxoglutarate aldolase
MTNLTNFILEKKIIAICRGIYGKDLLDLAAALSRGGIAMIEVTFDQSDSENLKKTAEAIGSLNAECPALRAGAGTVISAAQLKAAKSAGAEFIISPNTDVSIISATKEMGLVSIPGAMTPSEIASASLAGADFVKLFPAAQLGTSYVKAVLAPLNNVKLLATGGINDSNLMDYLKAGCVGAGIGGNLCDKKLIAAKEFDELEKIARRYTSQIG